MPSQQLAKSYRRKYKKLIDQFTLVTARQHHLNLQVTTRAQAALKLQAELDFLLDLLLDGKAVDVADIKPAGNHAEWVKNVLAVQAETVRQRAEAKASETMDPALKAAEAQAEAAAIAEKEAARAKTLAELGLTEEAAAPRRAKEDGPSQILIDLAADARAMLRQSRVKDLDPDYWHQSQPPHLVDLPWDLDLESKTGSYVADVQVQLQRLKQERATVAAMTERTEETSPVAGQAPAAGKRKQGAAAGKKRTAAAEDDDDAGKRKKKRRPV